MSRGTPLYYATLGFTVVPEQAQPAALAAIRRSEDDHAWPRVVMRVQTQEYLAGITSPRPMTCSDDARRGGPT